MAANSLGQVLRRIRLTEIAALVIGFLYVSGYYINSIFLRNLGVQEAELLRLEYIKIGFTFTLITLGFLFLPIGAFCLTYNVRKASGLPHYHLGAIGNSLNTTLCLAFPLFLAFFATRYEWDLRLPAPILGFTTLKGLILTFVAVALTGMAVVPFIERVVAARSPDRFKLLLFRCLVEPIRYGILTLSFVLIFECLIHIPWFGLLLHKGLFYFLAGGVFVAGITGAALWTHHIRDVSRSWLVYALIAFGLATLYYLAISSYVFGVYTFVPSNRGGRLPLTRAFLEVSGPETLNAGERVVGNAKLRGPVYVIEENEHFIYVASERMTEWLDGFVPVHEFRRETIPYIYLERIEDGFPRTVRHSGLPIKRPMMIPPEFYQARRVFQYDYIYVDAVFLVLWLLVLLRRKEYAALLTGAVIAPIIYLIDAYLWWNGSAGPTHPSGTFIRQYWIGGVAVPHPTGAVGLAKFGADFMMNISYALFTFPWLVIVFRHIRNRTLLSASVLGYTVLWFSMWFLTPVLSSALDLDNTRVETVRHMNSQFPFWIANLLFGYGLLLIVYRHRLCVVAKVFGVGLLGALIMETPLYIFGIRPTDFKFVLFEGVFLLNQGVPYLFLVFDKLVPLIRRHLSIERVST